MENNNFISTGLTLIFSTNDLFVMNFTEGIVELTKEIVNS